MKFFNWINIRLVLMIALVIFLFSFATIRNEHRKLSKTEIIFPPNEPLFISRESVNKLLIENKSDVKSIAKLELNLEKLEKTINAQPMVEKSEVFVSVDGVLKVKVKQKTPVARVFDEQGSFYIDNKGDKMPLSDLNTARVPLLTGTIDAVKKEQLRNVLNAIYKDDFLKKNIIGIEVFPNQTFLMKNRNYNFDIEFGSAVNIENKFKNYKAFFQKEVLDSTLYKYKKINLRYAHQVVCSR
jgi:cell division protein FtsQ